MVARSIEDVALGYSLRPRRRDNSIGVSSRTSSMMLDMRPRMAKRSRSQRFGVPTAALSTESGGTKRGHPLATPPFTPSKRQKVMNPSSFLPVPLALASEESTESELSSSVLSPSNGESPSPKANPGKTTPATPVSAKMKHDAIETPLTYFAGFTPAPTPNSARPTIEPESDATPTKPCDQRFRKESTPPPRKRVPGDYTLTPLLLSEPDSAWIRCTICSEAFV